MGAEFDLSEDSLLFATVSRGVERGGSIMAGTDTPFASSRYLDVGYTPLFKQKFGAVVKTLLGYTVPEDRSVVFVLCPQYRQHAVMTGGGQFFDFYSRPTLLPPRIYGVTARYNF